MHRRSVGVVQLRAGRRGGGSGGGLGDGVCEGAEGLADDLGEEGAAFCAREDTGGESVSKRKRGRKGGRFCVPSLCVSPSSCGIHRREGHGPASAPLLPNAPNPGSSLHSALVTPTFTSKCGFIRHSPRPSKVCRE